jgi:hypothetical protein
MGTEQDPGGADTAARGHEHRDVGVRTIVLVAAGLIGVTTLAQVAILFHMDRLWRARQQELPPPVPVAAALPTAPPEPRLQVAPSVDLKSLRAAEDRQLHGYGWIDRKAGVVHIPIERAMELMTEATAR